MSLLVVTGCTAGVVGAPAPAATTDTTTAPTATSATTATPGGVVSGPLVPPGAGPFAGAIPRPTRGGRGAGTVPPGLEAFYDQLLSWQPCGPFNTNPDLDEVFDHPELECANLIVPLDYAQPEGATVSVAVLRSKATGPDRVGSLLVNPGGPGASGVGYVASMVTADAGAAAAGTDSATTALRGHFDLVGFDTRGSGASRPRVDCLTDAERDARRASNHRTTTAAGVAALNAATRSYVAGCVARTGRDAGIDGARFLTTLRTDITARDVDVLRSVLGDAALDYVGYSYGTLLGALYADEFAAGVRAMVLDGAVDPGETPVSRTLTQLAAFQKAFDAFAQWCAGQLSCPLGSDPARATVRYREILRPLSATPLELSDGRLLTYSDATTGTVTALYGDRYWEVLHRALTALAGRDGGLLMALADAYLERDSTGRYATTDDVFTAVSCMDVDRGTSLSSDPSARRRAAAAAPFLDKGDPLVALAEPCDFWPGVGGLPVVDPGAALPTVVVVSTTGDPATPFANGAALARTLDGVVVAVDGERHGSFLIAGNACVDAAGIDYLVDLTVPAEGLRCS